MIGAIIGDIVGSRFEFHNTNTKNFNFFSNRCYFTDDTVMTCAVAESLMRCNGDYTNLYEVAEKTLRDVGRIYPNCGYGGMFINWMFNDEIGPYNSFGNGSAMRISPVGFIAKSEDEVKDLSYKVTAITHNHEEGLKGAECTAMCIFLARQGKSKDEIKEYVKSNYGYDVDVTVDEWRERIGGQHGYEICQVSIPEALSCFFESTDYEDCIRNCISIGGDSDTLGAIAGGIAQAYYGINNDRMIRLGKSFLDETLGGIVERFEQYTQNA